MYQQTATTAPGPRGYPLIGSLFDFTNDALATVVRDFPHYGDLMHYRVGPRQVFIISHPDLAQEVLAKRNREFNKLGGKANLSIFVGNGLIANTEHESWLQQRRMMQPMFHRQRLTAMGDKMAHAGTRMLDRWSAHPADKPLDMGVEMLQVTLDIIMQTMFSADVMNEAKAIGPAMNEVLHFTNRTVSNPFSLPLHWPTPQNRRFQHAKQYLDTIVYGLIAERRRSGDAPGDLLDMLLEARDADTGEQMSDEQIHDEVLTIFAAGHETTANTLAFAWYAISQNPDVRAKLEAELDSVLAGRTPTVADLNQLPYTQQVFREAMRQYPAAPFMGPRTPASDTKLGGYTIPAGSRVVTSIYNIHHHPAFWNEPMRFDPDRFGPIESAGRHPFAFMPFGAGPRKCIGNNLAEMEGALLLAMVAQRYHLNLVAGHTLVPAIAITLRPATGVPMLLHARS